MQDKQALETVAEIKRLSLSGDEEDKRRLLDMRTKLATTGNIDDRVLNALLNSFDDFDSSCMDLLLENGADSETIFKNEHVRDLALGVFEDALLENAYSYDDVDVKHNVVNWFFVIARTTILFCSPSLRMFLVTKTPGRNF